MNILTGKRELVKTPPSLKYLMDWATPSETAAIVREMREEGYQTMNLRLYATARLLLLKDLENEGKIVGRAGLDVGHSSMPEMFSYMVLPEYRGFHLGVLLNQARGAVIASRGFAEAYCRMNADDEDGLRKYRINSGIYRPLSREELSARWVSNCRQCELFGGKCGEQAYFGVDLGKLREYSIERVGPMLSTEFPKRVELRAEPTAVIGRPRYRPRWGDHPAYISPN